MAICPECRESITHVNMYEEWEKKFKVTESDVEEIDMYLAEDEVDFECPECSERLRGLYNEDDAQDFLCKQQLP